MQDVVTHLCEHTPVNARYAIKWSTVVSRKTNFHLTRF